jgi:hypothetical protein
MSIVGKVTAAVLFIRNLAYPQGHLAPVDIVI